MRHRLAILTAAIIALSAVAVVAQGNRVSVSIPTGDEVLASCAGGIIYVIPEGAARIVGCSAAATSTATVAVTPSPTPTPGPSGTPTITPTPTATGGAQSVTLPAIVAGGMLAELPGWVVSGASYIPTGFMTGQTNRALIHHDVTSLAVDWPVTGAVLQMKVDANFATTAHTIHVYRAGRRWISGLNPSASWDRYRQALSLPWATPGAAGVPTDRDGAAIGSVAVNGSTTGWVTIPLDAAAVQEWVDGTRPNNGLVLVASVENATTLIRWKGTSSPDRPRLVLDYTPAASSLLDGLVAYWPMDGGDYSDATACNRDLTPHNAPATVAGRIGDAAGFDKALGQWLSSGDAALKPGDQDWTWAGWVKLTDKVDFYAVAANRGADDQGFLLFYHDEDVLDYYVWQLNDDGTTGNGDQYISDNIGFYGGNPVAGEWVFIAARHDAARNFGQLFIDDNTPSSSGSHFAGEYSNSHWYSPYPGAPMADAADFTIGRRSTGNALFMHGAIDEVGFWQRWLTNAEIAALYNAGTGLAYPFGLTPTGCP